MANVESPNVSRPATEPSPAVQRAKAEARKSADVAKVGLTTTADGNWAVKVWLRKGAEPPVPAVESAAGDGVPVIYASEPDSPPLARPAFPMLGE